MASMQTSKNVFQISIHNIWGEKRHKQNMDGMKSLELIEQLEECSGTFWITKTLPCYTSAVATETNQFARMKNLLKHSRPVLHNVNLIM